MKSEFIFPFSAASSCHDAVSIRLFISGALFNSRWKYCPLISEVVLTLFDVSAYANRRCEGLSDACNVHIPRHITTITSLPVPLTSTAHSPSKFKHKPVQLGIREAYVASLLLYMPWGAHSRSAVAWVRQLLALAPPRTPRLPAGRLNHTELSPDPIERAPL